MGLENLKSIFSEGVGTPTSSPEAGRYSAEGGLGAFIDPNMVDNSSILEDEIQKPFIPSSMQTNYNDSIIPYGEVATRTGFLGPENAFIDKFSGP